MDILRRGWTHVVDGRVRGGGELFVDELVADGSIGPAQVITLECLSRRPDKQNSSSGVIFHNPLRMLPQIISAAAAGHPFGVFLHTSLRTLARQERGPRILGYGAALLLLYAICLKAEVIYAVSSEAAFHSLMRKTTIVRPTGFERPREGALSLVFVGRLHVSPLWGDVKGCRRLERLARELPGHTVHVFGEGPYAARLARLPNVVLHGFRSDVWQIVEALHAPVVLGLSRSEGFGRAIAEAQARGLRCLVTEAYPAEMLDLRCTSIVPFPAMLKLLRSYSSGERQANSTVVPRTIAATPVAQRPAAGGRG